MIAYHEPGAAQLRPDGTPWAFLLLNHAGVAVGADTVTELVDELLPDHEAASDEDRFLLRMSLLGDMTEHAQAIDLQERREADPSLDALLGEPGLTALVAPKLGAQLDMAVWPFDDVKLFLMATQYAPYTEMPAPMGAQVVLIDPSTERTFLDGLAALGAIELFVFEESMVEALSA